MVDPKPTMTEAEMAARLKALLQREIDHAKPKTVREFRLCAIRVANDFPIPAMRDELYNVFCEMMGIGTQTAKDETGS